MNSHDFSQVPFTAEVVFRGSLHTEPVAGDSAVCAFLVAVGKGARGVQLKWRVIDGERACAHYEYQSNAGSVVPAVTCFRFEAGQIAELRAFFDPRPFLTSRPHGNETSGPDEQVAGHPHHRVVPLTPDGMQKFLKRGFEVVSGNPDVPGAPFVIRIYNTENQVVPPHWHPEDEHITVTKGTWCVGEGDTFNQSALREMNVGDYVFVPKQMRHYAWSKTPTVVQIHGIGPFKINLADPWLFLSDKVAAPYFKFKLNDRVKSKRGEGVVVFGAYSEKDHVKQYVVQKSDGEAFSEFEAQLENVVPE